MLRIESYADASAAPQARLILPFELRQKSRLLCRTEEGEEVGLFLSRGSVLRGGQRLLAHDGRIVEVLAAPERLLVVRALTAQDLARAAYHLGNRHVPLEVRADRLVLEPDHVLAALLVRMGLQVEATSGPFEPEAGAYEAAARPAAHAHDHDDGHDHGHEHHHHRHST
jgi:urease accessory protein